MIIPGILTKQQIGQLHEALREVRWLDGKETAGAVAKGVKDNEQADLTDRRGAHIAQQLTMAIGTNAVVSAAALPKRVSTLRLSRTNVGGGYGTHFDNAIMAGRDGMLRTDISFTLFLSEPDDYDGGELTIYGRDEDISHKLPAGDLVLYPSGALHEVKQVTRGARIVCVGWIQSLVGDADKRGLLFEMRGLGADLEQRLGADADETRLAQKLHADLMRQWADA